MNKFKATCKRPYGVKYSNLFSELKPNNIYNCKIVRNEKIEISNEDFNLYFTFTQFAYYFHEVKEIRKYKLEKLNRIQNETMHL